MLAGEAVGRRHHGAAVTTAQVGRFALARPASLPRAEPGVADGLDDVLRGVRRDGQEDYVLLRVVAALLEEGQQLVAKQRTPLRGGAQLRLGRFSLTFLWADELWNYLVNSLAMGLE